MFGAWFKLVSTENQIVAAKLGNVIMYYVALVDSNGNCLLQ